MLTKADVARPRNALVGVTSPSGPATAVLLIACFLAATLPSGGSYEMAHQAAIIMGLALAASLALELLQNVRNAMRVDLLMLLALYGLIYAEFLVEQPELLFRVSPQLLGRCLMVMSLGVAGIVLGRHWRVRATGLRQLTSIELTPRALIYGIAFCAFLGYLNMLWSVNFNPVRLIEAMIAPRFSQPWTRGRLGGWSSLLSELSLFIYLIPPAVGVVIARHKVFNSGQKALAYGFLLLTLFYGFTSGTRNIFFVFVLGLLGGYLLTVPTLSRSRLLKLLAASMLVLLFASQVMLEFRMIGLKNYSQLTTNGERSWGNRRVAPSEFFIDNNLYTLSNVLDYFPRQSDYLGWEVPYWALVKPIPRALWPGKPEGLSVAIEQARDERGASAATWATTFIGEAYMSAGPFGVFGIAFLLGVAAAWWNTLLRDNQGVYRKLLYASGIFAALITMRSLFWFTTAVLPTLALLLYGHQFLKRRPHG